MKTWIALTVCLWVGARGAGPDRNTFIRVDQQGWQAENGNEYYAALNALNEMADTLWKSPVCSPECHASLYMFLPGGPYGNCSMECFLSLMPPGWLAYWNTLASEKERAVWKPDRMSATEGYRFYQDSVVYALDSSIVGYGPMTNRNEPDSETYRFFGNRTRIVFADWTYRNDTLFLRRGTRVHEHNPGRISKTSKGIEWIGKCEFLPPLSDTAYGRTFTHKGFRFRGKVLREVISIPL